MAKSDRSSARRSHPDATAGPFDVRPLPPRANLEHLKNQAKQRLAELRRETPQAKLADAQFAIAQEYGFTSWRALKTAVEGQPQQRDAMLAAVKAGDTATLVSLLDRHPHWVDAAVEDRQTRVLPTDTRAMRLLHVAVAENQPEVARLLLQRGANPNPRNADGRTPLHDCWELNPHRAEIRDLLMRHGAELDAALAAVVPDLDRLRELLTGDPSLANDRTTNLSPLAWATVGWSHEAAQLLIEHGADFRSEPGRRDVMWALAATASPDLLRVLLDAGLDPDSRFPDGDTLLHRAIRGGNEDLTAFAALLLDGGLDPNAANDAGRTLLDEAIAADGEPVEEYATRAVVGHKRYAGLIGLLRTRGGVSRESGAASPESPASAASSDPPAALDPSGEAVDAAQEGDARRLAAVLDRHPNAIHVTGGTWDQPLLHLAAWRGHLDVVNLLLERGFEVNTRDKRGQRVRTALCGRRRPP